MALSLVVLYGPPFVGKSTLAWALARSFTAKTAVVSADGLLGGAIAVPDADALAELGLVHTQLRLLVANYLKSGYNVVLEGPFMYQRRGQLLDHEAEIDQLVSLMRHLAAKRLVVRLDAADKELRRRAAAAGRDIEAVLRVSAAFKPRSGANARVFDTAAQSAAEIATVIQDTLGGD